MQPVLHIHNLCIHSAKSKLLELPDLIVNPQNIHAIIGESGSGKSLTLLAIMGLLPKNLRVSGEIWLHTPNEKVDLLTISPEKIRNLRGKLISMVFQEPMSALNPQMTCGDQLLESYLVHDSNKAQAKVRISEKLNAVGLGAIEDRVLQAYPHQLSGGQRQRVMIAMASLHNPLLILADEPTTALDSFSRNQVMADFTQLAKSMNSALIWVSHELDLVAQYAQDITVLRRGEFIEQGTTLQIMNHPSHDYVKQLLAAVPRPKQEVKLAQTPSLIIHQIAKVYGKGKWAVNALKPYTVSLSPGQTLAVIGTSGSGKSTLAKLLVALELPSGGQITLDDQNLPENPPTGIQMVFQDPYASLNRNHSARYAIEEILKLKHPEYSIAEHTAKALIFLKDVGFDERLIEAFPDQMSGGQRQRLCIAKALATDPKVLILDEAVAALDPIIQQQILELLTELQLRKQLIYIFITHNLEVAKSLADVWCYLDAGEAKPIPESWGILNQ